MTTRTGTHSNHPLATFLEPNLQRPDESPDLDAMRLTATRRKALTVPIAATRDRRTAVRCSEDDLATGTKQPNTPRSAHEIRVAGSAERCDRHHRLRPIDPSKVHNILQQVAGVRTA